MKKLIYLALSLMLLSGSIRLNAQTECPNIEWMRFFNNDKLFFCNLSKINNDGTAIVYGSYGGSPTLGNYNLPVAAGGLRENGFIAKVDSTGNPLWVKVAEIINNDQANMTSLQTDTSGNSYATIKFAREMDFDDSTYTNNNLQQENTLLVKLSPQGQVLWTKLYENCSFSLIHVDGLSQYYCTTSFSNTFSIDGHSYVSNGLSDILIFKLNQQGNLSWAQQIGGIGDENINNYWVDGTQQYDSRADSQSNLYIAGYYTSPAIMLGSTQLTNTNSSEGKYFVTKIDSSGNYQWVKGLPEHLVAADLEIDNNHNVYFTGSVYDTATIGNTTINVPYELNYSYLIKYNPITDQFPMVMVFKGGRSAGERLLYLPSKNEMIMTGWFKDSVNFMIQDAASTTGDFFVLGTDLDSSVEQLSPQWIIYTRVAAYGESGGFLSMIKDSKENVYSSGVYTTDSISFGSYNFPATPSLNNSAFNGFQAKLAFLNREVTVNNGTLTAVQSSAIYQWLDCNNGMQPIPGATNQSFSPAQPGNYAVRVSNSLCSVVSDCINTTGISGNQLLQQIHVYPNPVQQQLNLSHLPLGAQVAVYDVLGRAVYSGIAESTTLQINTRQWVAGLYMVVISKNGGKKMVKVLKE